MTNPLISAIERVDAIKEDIQQRHGWDFDATADAGGNTLNAIFGAYGITNDEVFEVAHERFLGAIAGIAEAIRGLELDAENTRRMVQEIGPSLWADGVIVGLLMVESESIPEKEA